MNILFVESSIPPNNGGVERVSWLLRNYFKKNNKDFYWENFETKNKYDCHS